AWSEGAGLLPGARDTTAGPREAAALEAPGAACSVGAPRVPEGGAEGRGGPDERWRRAPAGCGARLSAARRPGDGGGRRRGRRSRRRGCPGGGLRSLAVLQRANLRVQLPH